MGLAKSKIQPFRILVLGLTNAGKTHFLDMFHFGSDSTKIPTYGYYETVFKHSLSKREIVLTEYGGDIKWKTVLKGQGHVFDAVYMVIRSTASPEEIMESNNALLMIMEELPDAVAAVIWNIQNDAPFHSTLLNPPRKPSSCVCFLDFNNLDWRERVSELIEWSIVNRNSVKSQAV